MPEFPNPATLPARHDGTPLTASGTKIIDGILYEEYNQKLTGERKWREYEKMANDPHIAEVQQAVKMPIIRADWEVERGADTPLDREMEDFSNDMVFDRKSDPFRGFLDPALDFLFEGFSWFEKIFIVKRWGPQKKLFYQWKQVAWRHARTVFRWYFDPDDLNLDGLQQYAQFIGKKGEAHYRYQDIGVQYLLVFVHNKRGQNFGGRGGYRFMWSPWRKLSTFEKILAIFYDRTGAGVPVVHVPKGTSEERKDALAEALSQYRSGEKSYLILEEGEELAWHQGASKGQVDMIKGMQFERETIGKGVLAPFLNYGTTQTGSRALGDTMVDFFMAANQGIADHVAEDYNTHALHKLLALNFKVEPGDMPKLVAKGIDARDVKKQAEAVKTYIDAGVIDPAGDAEMENRARKAVAMPELSEAELKLAQKANELELKNKAKRLADEKKALAQSKNKTPEKGDGDGGDTTPGAPPSTPPPSPPSAPPVPPATPAQPAAPPSQVEAHQHPALDLSGLSENSEELIFAKVRNFVDEVFRPDITSTRTPARPMKDIERRSFEFGEREKRYVDLAKRLGSKAGNFFSSYIEQVIKAANAGKDPFSIVPKGDKPAAGFKFPRTVRNMRLEMLEGYRLGIRDLKDEAKKLAGKEKRIDFSELHLYAEEYYALGLEKEFQAGRKRVKPPTEQALLDELEEELDVRLNLGIQKIQNQAKIALTRVKRRGLIGREKISFLTNSMAQLSEALLRSSVREALNIAYGEGRRSEEFRLNPDQLVRSAVFDASICDTCAKKDGVVFRAGDPTYDELPDPECFGGARCRCINIPLPPGEIPGPAAVQRAVTDRPVTVSEMEAEVAERKRLEEIRRALEREEARKEAAKT